MGITENNYKLLIKRLDQFIKKYYLNKAIKGSLLFFGGILASFLLASFLEYQFYFGEAGRKIIFYSFLFINIALLSAWVLAPLLKYFRLGKIITREEAAQIIGRHFSEVEDKLLNILQLKNQSGLPPAGQADASLINASIEQRIKNLQPIPFASIIKIKDNKKYLRYALPPFLVLLVLLFAAPNLITESSKRLINYDQHFVKKAPFRFVVMNEKLEIIQFRDFPLKLKIEGEALPNEVYINSEGRKIKLQKEQPNIFTYNFSNVNKDEKFFFTASDFNSEEYELKVHLRPSVANFITELKYPKYTGKKDEQQKNTGDIVVPEGTLINWKFFTENTEGLTVKWNYAGEAAQKQGKNTYTLSKKASKNAPYTIIITGAQKNVADSVQYAVTVIPDAYPSIIVQQFKDSTDIKTNYFIGEVSDDYGLQALYYKYKIIRADDSIITGKEPLELTKTSRHRFNYYLNVADLGLLPGDELTYYFEVWDNDGINGSKASRSATFTYKMPTYKEFKEQKEKTNDEIKEVLSSSKKAVQELKKSVQDMQNKLVQKKNLTWEDKEALKKLLEEQKRLQKEIESIQEKFKQNANQQEDYQKTSENLKQKQKQLQDLLDQVMTDELKKLFEKMEAMLEELNKQQAMQQLEEFELTEEQLEKEMDRMLELFKKLEFEQQIAETIDELNKLAEEQKELQQETQDKDKNSEELAKEQENINKDFEGLQKQIEGLKKKDEEISSQQNDFQKVDQQSQDTEQNLQQSLENLQQSKEKKASESQQKAAQQMQQMAASLQQMQQQMASQQMELDLRAIRQILENLVQLSFDQEALINKTNETNVQSPEYVKVVQQQHKIREDAKLIEDSLFALGKRVFQIQSFVNEQISDINKHMEKSIDELEQRRKNPATARQQFVMTGANNLALMLSEVMDQMQQQMAQQMPGNQMCNNPGNKKKGQNGMPSLRQMQEQLNKQMQEMAKGMKDGKGKSRQQMSKEVAQMAAKQAAIREAMEKLAEQMGKDGKENSREIEKISEKMDQTEEDLVNKKITEELLERQKEILTRLLDAEKAEKERETDNERKAETAKKQSKEMPPSIEEYLKKKEAEVELLKTVPPALRPYYKDLVEQYFNKIHF